MSYPSQLFPLKINSVAGEQLCCLQVQAGQLIGDVKSLLEEQLQVPSRFQSLTQTDVTLGDLCTVGQCGLERGATVILVKESVGQDGLVQALRRDIESLLPRGALDGANPEVPRRGPLSEYGFNGENLGYPAATTKPGDMKQDENGFLMSKCSHSLLASYLLKSGADPNYVLPQDSLCHYGITQISNEPEFGGTALHYAARLGLPDVCRQILQDERFSKINLKDNFGRSALHLAALATVDDFADGRNSMRAEVCRLLVQDEKCDVNLTQGFDEDEDGYEKFVELFGDADPDSDQGTSLHVAGGCDVIVEALLSSPRVDCSTPYPGRDGLRPLNGCISYRSRHTSSLKTCLLFAKVPGINLNSKSQDGGTVPQQLLRYTDGQGDIEEEMLAMEVVFEFVKNKNYDAAKCHLSKRSYCAQEPLICCAAAWGSPELLDYLLKDEKIDPNEKSRNMCQTQRYGTTPFPASGQTLLHYACEGMSLSPWAARNVSAVLQCDRFTESVNVQDELGRTAFHVATRRALPGGNFSGLGGRYNDNFQGFIEESPLGILWNNDRVDVNLRDVNGETALHVVIGLTEAIEEFTEKENLFEALAEANSLCGVFLRSNRFNVTEDEIRSFLVQRVLFKAIQDGDDNVEYGPRSGKGAEIIEKFWAHPGVTSLNGGKNNPLVNAATQGNVEMCKRLLADPRFTAVNGTNGDGDTALTAVAFPDGYYMKDDSCQPNIQIIRLLLEDPRTDLAVGQDFGCNGRRSLLYQFLDKMSTAEPQWLDLARAFLKDPRTDTNCVPRNGKTPLHQVCSCSSDQVSTDDQTELCKLILKNANFKGINAIDKCGKTALINAAEHNDAAMGLNAAKMLLEDTRTDEALEYAAYLNGEQGGAARNEMLDLLFARMES